MKKLLFLILIPFLGIAQTFTANRIKYTVTSSTAPFTVKVARNANFTGAAEIPETVAYNSENYAVTAIGESAFEHCNNLTSVTIPNSATTIGKDSFVGCSGLISVTIPNSVTDIENAAFFGCIGLTSVTIPNSVTVIRRGIFAGCSGLISVTIPNSVTAIENFAFFGCFGLTSVTIPNSVTAIEERAFAECSSLRTVNCHITSPLVINKNVFHNVTQSNCALNVPTGTQAVYQAAAVWKDFSPISGSLLSNHSFAIESNLKIYPNPVSEILNIALQEGLQLEKVNFYNTLGQLIKTTNHSEINVSSFAKGNYFVEVITNQGKATKTIIIQ
ncbi:leucine-rich repeat domain-containing protein [Flavobacterium psychrophilum]|uniref:leucine-rich repeat domain-containing protein n=6 Tax=Flavobacterium psychrophilum TaxID=96345 RepID=UPI00106920B0|nr:leucine-rich repeat domain-containing protein [Flavobacterium psychrophilum]EKT4510739.1 leucine-rich repeat domain-containing protein [Flavobacterium psychrophilum]EKT4548336.1 leucine-rich repeat domain-containing protein [Flavobacterium psychrophilum]MEB3392055.1 leucine-rich repeat domain-containing protein [Flavobacterium psychrophilum]QLL30175.1 leucine-rich repeat domain-containing protein [Flavobacterium psychrophilum]UOP30489.1 leucine-rich repeat protein [Flavobacterium psychrophi